MASGDVTNYLKETELLVRLVRERPALYDRSRTDFKDPAYKQFMWQEIGDLMGCTSQEIYKKWISLRDRYTAEHRKLKKNPGLAQSGWPFYESMRFLEKHIIERRRILPHIYGSLRDTELIKETTNVKLESFDSGVLGDSPWDGGIDNSLPVEIGYVENPGTDQVVTPDAVTTVPPSKRYRSISPSTSPISIKRDKLKLEEGLLDSLRDIGNATKQIASAVSDAENADKLFGKMVGVMVGELNSDDKNRAKIHIMSYLCTHGYKNNESN
ncbi:transcription factor Adf-1-like [Neodiprion virginianus]|uniref:transcription factor Adf-1-like n=1 Tax=Neodiprion virginianus TaxID=2961670 RepID=UPI001EE6C6FB|nr:transcription factor Adf-1-like [Neodiprion virginianus]